MNLSHPRVLQMVTDSLRYWRTEMHVDGFRFDEGTILGREGAGFDQSGGFLDSCLQDPVLSQVKLIAEPWDPGPGGYQVGSFPPGWAEWNDRYRDTVRSFWKGDEGKVAEMASRLAASADLFNKMGRKPWASVNPNSKVRREKALVHSGWKSRPGAGSFRPVTIEAVVEVTKPLKPSVQRVAMATR
jgi:glycogen operon protein